MQAVRKLLSEILGNDPTGHWRKDLDQGRVLIEKNNISMPYMLCLPVG